MGCFVAPLSAEIILVGDGPIASIRATLVIEFCSLRTPSQVVDLPSAADIEVRRQRRDQKPVSGQHGHPRQRSQPGRGVQQHEIELATERVEHLPQPVLVAGAGDLR